MSARCCGVTRVVPDECSQVCDSPHERRLNISHSFQANAPFVVINHLISVLSQIIKEAYVKYVWSFSRWQGRPISCLLWFVGFPTLIHQFCATSKARPPPPSPPVRWRNVCGVSSYSKLSNSILFLSSNRIPLPPTKNACTQLKLSKRFCGAKPWKNILATSHKTSISKSSSHKTNITQKHVKVS